MPPTRVVDEPAQRASRAAVLHEPIAYVLAVSKSGAHEVDGPSGVGAGHAEFGGAAGCELVRARVVYGGHLTTDDVDVPLVLPGRPRRAGQRRNAVLVEQ